MEAHELEVLAPAKVPVKLWGETVEVSPFVMGQIVRILTECKDLIRDLSGAKDADVADLILKHPQQILLLCAIAVNRTIEDVGKLDMAEFTHLAGTVIALNIDFFIQRVAPAVRDMVGKVTTNLTTILDGLTLSKD